MSQLKGYSPLMGELDFGPQSEDLDAILGLGDMMASGRPNLIVYVEGPVLQKWGESE